MRLKFGLANNALLMINAKFAKEDITWQILHNMKILLMMLK